MLEEKVRGEQGERDEVEGGEADSDDGGVAARDTDDGKKREKQRVDQRRWRDCNVLR